MKLPVVTVITATFNLINGGREKSIVQAIESVQSQDYEGCIEHIVIDGASDDGTLELLEPFERKGWITLYSEKDSGIYDAMNKGIAKASGKYVVFLNSDDRWIDRHGITESVNALEAESADFSFAPELVEECDNVFEMRPHSLQEFYFRMPFGHQSMLVRTEVLREFGGFDSARYRIAADYDFFLKIMLAGKKAVFVDRSFCLFRKGGVSDNTFRTFQEYVEIIYSNIGKLHKITKEECYALFMRYAYFSSIEEKCISMAHVGNKKYFSSNVIDKLGYDVLFKKNIFRSYFGHRIKILFLRGEKKEYTQWKIDFEKKIIASCKRRSFRVLGLPVFETYERDNICSFHILGIPLITQLKAKKKEH